MPGIHGGVLPICSQIASSDTSGLHSMMSSSWTRLLLLPDSLSCPSFHMLSCPQVSVKSQNGTGLTASKTVSPVSVHKSAHPCACLAPAASFNGWIACRKWAGLRRRDAELAARSSQRAPSGARATGSARPHRRRGRPIRWACVPGCSLQGQTGSRRSPRSAGRRRHR